MNYLVLLVALLVASVAAYFSIIGIGLIFSGSFWAAVVMGCALETAKIVAVSWLYRNWDLAHRLLKTYLIGAIVVLSLITSLGIFGFLSRAHIEQTNILNTGAASQIELVDNQIAQQRAMVTEIDQRRQLIVNAQQKLIDRGQARTSISVGDQQRKQIAALDAERNKANAELNDLITKKTKLTNAVKTAEVEVGPIRYVAEFFFNKSDTTTLERAVRWMIIVIIFVFDPLSIALFIAYNTGAMKPKYVTTLTERASPDMISIHKSNLKEM